MQLHRKMLSLVEKSILIQINLHHLLLGHGAYQKVGYVINE